MEVFTTSVLELPYTASSVGIARRRLVGDLAGAGASDGAAADAGLIISELISNALRHASPLPGSTFRAAWQLGADSVEIAVSDGGGPTVPTIRAPVGSAVGGRGLGIVEQLSRRWGVSDAAGETTVWAELPLRHDDQDREMAVSVSALAYEA